MAKPIVLVVDDEESVPPLLKELLENDYDVVTASSGEKALQLASTLDDLDVAVVDLVMPGMRGADLIPALKERFPCCFVVAMTGYADINEVGEAFAKGADDLLVKPLHADTVRTKVAQLVAHRTVCRERDDALEREKNLARKLAEANAKLEKELEALRSEHRREMENLKFTQRMLRVQHERITTVVNSIEEGMVVVDNSWEILLANRAAQDILGVKAQMGIDIRSGGLGHSEALQHTIILAASEALEGNTFKDRARTDIPGKGAVYHEVVSAPVKDEKTDTVGAVITLRDVTDEVVRERGRLAFLSIVAHELRTPLTGIKVLSTMLSRGKLGELSQQQAKAATEIFNQTLRLERQVDRIVNLMVIEAQEFEPDIEETDLNRICAGVVDAFNVIAAEKDISISFVHPEGEARVRADGNAISRVLSELVENAIKFSNPGSEVKVEISELDDAFECTVSDRGIGIPEHERYRVFEPYVQLEPPETRRFPGTGLGLTIVKGVLDAHGVDVNIESKVGEGTTVSFRLPKA